MKNLHRAPLAGTAIRYVGITGRHRYFELLDKPILKKLLAKLTGVKSEGLAYYNSESPDHGQRDSLIARTIPVNMPANTN
jgi:hypothetical protein